MRLEPADALFRPRSGRAGRRGRGGGSGAPVKIDAVHIPPALDVWDSYEAIVEACADAWNFFVNDPDRIRSIGTRDWATVNL